MEIRIGTSGWHYKHWVGPFYRPTVSSTGMLDYYVHHFDTVELNNTFYRLPAENAVRMWRDSVPNDFIFAVKASSFLTHRIKLKNPERGLDNFLARIMPLGPRLGPIIFQLPPQWPINQERLEGLLELLPKRLRYAFEFRNVSWHVEPVYDLLRKHNAALCMYELAGYCAPSLLTADFTYIRLHGPAGKYQGKYNRQQLARWAKRIEGWKRTLRAVYVYFDNDQAGYAAKNALDLKSMVSKRMLQTA